MKRYMSVHGHFYQPPRENPVTGLIPVEIGAAPYHDWNEKILAECYRPNAEHGNFDRMNFDIGPTLGLWMARTHPDVLARIVAGDRSAVARTGYGNAIMQSFHHTILPLATERDRRTELRWGVRWFEHIFGRRPVGIWLPETAVDYPTLESCAAAGLRFTILSPDQAARVVDMRYPYRVNPPSGRTFDVVFYEGPLSGTISFDPFSTNSAPDFVEQFLKPRVAGIPEGVSEGAIILIASDGEVYGHHHPFKDYFLQDLLQHRAEAAGLTPVSLEQYLAIQRPAREVGIRERSSWGCAHDLLRWRGDCACTPGNGAWKGVMRETFDALAKRIDAVTEELSAGIVDDVWTLRDEYVDVVIGAIDPEAWLEAHDLPASGPTAARVLTLMEAQRRRLAMYASCAFYWDDLTRLEAAYGTRSALFAAKLLDQAFGTDLRAVFTARLGQVVGWKSQRSALELYAAAGE